jgi:hypothetical protein
MGCVAPGEEEEPLITLPVHEDIIELADLNTRSSSKIHKALFSTA